MVFFVIYLVWIGFGLVWFVVFSLVSSGSFEISGGVHVLASLYLGLVYGNQIWMQSFMVCLVSKSVVRQSYSSHFPFIPLNFLFFCVFNVFLLFIIFFLFWSLKMVSKHWIGSKKTAAANDAKFHNTRKSSLASNGRQKQNNFNNRLVKTPKNESKIWHSRNEERKNVIKKTGCKTQNYPLANRSVAHELMQKSKSYRIG